MKYKRFLITALLFLLVFAYISVSAKAAKYYFQDRSDDMESFFFLVALDEDDDFKADLEHDKEGKFYIFVFDERPTETHVKPDRTFDKDIYDEAETYDTGNEPHINYTADKDEIYYVQVVLLRGGPDFFTLETNKELTRYYIPQIPGYPLEIMIFSIIGTVGLIVIVYKKKFL